MEWNGTAQYKNGGIGGTNRLVAVVIIVVVVETVYVLQKVYGS